MPWKPNELIRAPFHATTIDLHIIFQCKLYKSCICLGEINLHDLYNFYKSWQLLIIILAINNQPTRRRSSFSETTSVT